MIFVSVIDNLMPVVILLSLLSFTRMYVVWCVSNPYDGYAILCLCGFRMLFMWFAILLCVVELIVFVCEILYSEIPDSSGGGVGQTLAGIICRQDLGPL